MTTAAGRNHSAWTAAAAVDENTAAAAAGQ